MIPTAYAAIIGAPLLITSKLRIKDILNRAGIKDGDKFYELGTGTGRVMVAVANHTGAEVIGVELSPIFYFVTLLNLKINRVKNYKLYLSNFFKVNFGDADAVFCFLIPKSMNKLAKKFNSELKPGAKIISFAFPIECWIPYKTIGGDNEPRIYFYKSIAAAGQPEQTCLVA